MLKYLRVLVLVLLVAGCSEPGAGPSLFASPLLRTNAGIPEFSHIFVILLENRESGEVMGSPQMPYLNSLAQQYASAGQYYGITHPSLPNYLALTGGSTFGITSDCVDCFVSGDNLANQLKAAGRSWKAYMESLPAPCFVGEQGQYAQRHDPFIYYDNVRNDPGQCKNIVPFTQFATDLSSQNLPDFNWISPNLCNDMHDCDNAAGDTWLRTWVPQILASPAWQDRGALFVLFDEGSTNAGCCQYAAGGKVAMLAVSPLAKRSYVSNAAYDHYSWLRTVEEAWRLPLLGNAGSPNTTNLADLFTTSNPSVAGRLPQLIATPLASVPPAAGGTPGIASSTPMTTTATASYEFDWQEGSNFTIAEWWNAPSTAGCAYAANPWPRQALALHRAFALAARQVLRNEWDIGRWIAQNRAATSEARIHGAETGCYGGHADFPAHIHVFYLARDAKGTWLHLNTHNYIDAQGRFNDDFVIPDLCGQTTSYHVPANQWLSMLDEKCTTVWQQRYTTAGDFELRRSTTAPTYALRARSASGDLASADVLLGGKVIATVEITKYDPLAMTMVATINDYARHQQTVESWQGDPATNKNLATHTVRAVALAASAPAPIAPGALLSMANGATPGSQDGNTVTVSVQAGQDNAYQDGTTLTVDDKTIYVGDNKDPNNSYAGIRFDGVPVAAGAAVRKATLQLYSTSATKTPLKLSVYGEAIGESQPFGPNNLPGQMPATTAHVSYDDKAGWNAGAWYSIDVTPIVNEIANRPDWNAGQALTIVVKGASGQQGYRREVQAYASWDEDHKNVPQLIIGY